MEWQQSALLARNLAYNLPCRIVRNLISCLLILLTEGSVPLRGAILPFSTVITNSALRLTIDFGQTNTFDGLFVGGTNVGAVLPMWPNNVNAGWGISPVGAIRVYVGDTSPATTLVGEQWVPPDAGTNIETQASIRFSPVAGRYMTIAVVTNQNWAATNAYWKVVAPPDYTTWDHFLIEPHGLAGTFTNKDAVVGAKFSNAGTLNQAAADLSYYLSELEGAPVPIISPGQTNLYPGTIYRVMDLQHYARTYFMMKRNMASGLLPTNVTVTVSGTREVDFTGWPYRDVLFGVWQFLEKQGVRWYWTDEHSDSVPYGAGVSLSSLPYNYQPSATSIYADWYAQSLKPWDYPVGAPARQGYLNLWRNHWTCSQQAPEVLGGAEVPAQAAPGGLHRDYAEGFAGYPHNYASVVPARILAMTNQILNGVLCDSNWWGESARSGCRVNPSTGDYSGDATPITFCNDNTNLIQWVAQKIIACDHAVPLDSIAPLDLRYFTHRYGLLPMDGTIWCQDPIYCSRRHQSQPVGDAWVYLGGQTFSSEYFYFVTSVAAKVATLGGHQTVGALAYANVNTAPTNMAPFPGNVQVAVCMYGAPDLPISAAINASVSNNWVNWHTLTTNLDCYDYTLLHVDYPQVNDLLPVPLTAGIVDRAKFLASLGALNGGCQATPQSLQYNPWNFYVYPRIRWNSSLTESNLLDEFFKGFYAESAVPMLNFYNVYEQNIVANNIDMRLAGYAYTIVPGTFTYSSLYQMETNLSVAESLATNYITRQRLNTISNQFAWILSNMGLTGVDLTNGSAMMQIGTNATVKLQASDLTPLQTFVGAGGTAWPNEPTFATGPGGRKNWTLFPHNSVQATLNFSKTGYYQVVVNGGYNYFGPGTLRVDIGAYATTFTLTNAGNSSVDSYTNIVYAQAGINQVMLDTFKETNNSSIPAMIYSISLQFLGLTPPAIP